MRPREAETLPGLLGELAARDARCADPRRTTRSPRRSSRSAPPASRRPRGGSASAPATASRCGCPTAPSGWSCTSRSPASARSRSPINTRFRAHEVQRPARALAGAARSPSRPASRASTSRASSARRARPSLIRVGEPGYEALRAARARRRRLRARRALRRVHLVGHDRRARSSSCTPSAGSSPTRAPSPTGFGYDAPDCVALAMLPLCGVFGYDSALGALAGGAPVVLQEAFDAGEAARAGRAPRRHPRQRLRRDGAAAARGRARPAAARGRLRRLRRRPARGRRRRRRRRHDRLHVLRLDRGPGAARARAAGRHARSGARSPAARPVSPGDRGAGHRRRRARGPRPERDGRLPRRRAPRSHRRRLPPHGRPRPRDATTASPSPPAAATRCAWAASSSARARSRPSSSRATTSPRRPSSPSSTRAPSGPSPSPSRATARARRGRGARALPREPRRLQGAAPRDRARRAAVHRLPQRPQGPARRAAPARGRSTSGNSNHDVRRAPCPHHRRPVHRRDPPREAVAERPAGRERTTGSTSPRRPSSSELHSSRRRFTLTGMAIQTGALILVMGALGFAPDAMGKPAIGIDHLGAARRAPASCS